jgi:hypothetical protein
MLNAAYHESILTTMAIVIMKGWKQGLQKVSLSKLQVDILNMPLKEAKANVDALLDGREVAFEIGDEAIAKKFFSEAQLMGVEGVLHLP